MEKVFANIDSIVGVKVYYEKLTKYEFHQETQDVIDRGLWGLYEKIVKFGKPARWLKPGDRDNYHFWLTDFEVREWEKAYRIQEFPKKLFKNPYVEIRYVNKDTSYVYFKSDQELDDYINSLRNKMGSRLVVIK